MVRIYKGNDVDFGGIGEITVSVLSSVDITGYTGKFEFLGVVKSFSAETIALRNFTFSYTAEETADFCLGLNFGTFTMYDTKGRRAVVAKVPVEVTLNCPVCTCSGNEIFVSMDMAFDYGRMGNKPKINGVTLEGEYDGRHYKLQRIPAFN